MLIVFIPGISNALAGIRMDSAGPPIKSTLEKKVSKGVKNVYVPWSVLRRVDEFG